MPRAITEHPLRVFQPFLVACVACVCSSASLAIAEDTPQASRDRPPYVSPATVQHWHTEGRAITFLDVREADEFTAGHLAGAINVPAADVASLADRLPHDQPIVVYCIHSAHRAPEAAQTLRHLGFHNAYVLEGGIVAWQAGGLTILASDYTTRPVILPKTERCEQVGPPSSS